MLGSAVFLPTSSGQSSSGFDVNSTSSGVSPGGGYLQWKLYDGCVNATTFLGCEPETLLFEGAEEEPSFMMTAQEPPLADPLLQGQRDAQAAANRGQWSSLWLEPRVRLSGQAVGLRLHESSGRERQQQQRLRGMEQQRAALSAD